MLFKNNDYSEIVSNGKCMSFEGFLVVTRLTHYFSYLYKQKKIFAFISFFHEWLYIKFYVVLFEIPHLMIALYMCFEQLETPFLLIPYMISYFRSNLYRTSLIN